MKILTAIAALSAATAQAQQVSILATCGPTDRIAAMIHERTGAELFAQSHATTNGTTIRFYIDNSRDVVVVTVEPETGIECVVFEGEHFEPASRVLPQKGQAL